MRIIDTDWTTEAAAAGLELVVTDDAFQVSGGDVRVRSLKRQRYAARVVVGVDGVEVVGHSIVEAATPGGFWDQLGFAGSVEIGMLAVRSDRRRRGVAHQLVEHIVHTSPEQVVVAWRPNNINAARMFASWDELGVHHGIGGFHVVCAAHRA